MTTAQQAQQAPTPATRLSLAQLQNLARQAGFTGGDVDTIAAVAYYESRQGDPNAIGKNDNGSLDKGILQINSVWDAQIPDSCKFNPLCAFQAAFHTIVPAQGFHAWTSYSGGQYKQYLTGAGGSATDSLAGASIGVNLGPMGPAAPAASSSSKPGQDCWFSVPIPGVGPIGGGSVCVPNPISGVGSAVSGAASGLRAWWAKENVIQRSIALVVGLGLLAVGAAALVLATSGVDSSDVRTAAGVVGKAAVVAG